MTANPPPERRVFVANVRFTVEAQFFVLATDLSAARDALRHVDLQDYIGLTPETIHTDDTSLLRFNDIYTTPIDLSAVELAPMYPPNAHPNFTGVPRK